MKADIGCVCYYFAYGRGAKYCDESVCLSVSPLTYLRNHKTKLYQIFPARWLWPWLGPHLAALRYVLYFRFCEWRHIFI